MLCLHSSSSILWHFLSQPERYFRTTIFCGNHAEGRSSVCLLNGETSRKRNTFFCEKKSRNLFEIVSGVVKADIVAVLKFGNSCSNCNFLFTPSCNFLQFCAKYERLDPLFFSLLIFHFSNFFSVPLKNKVKPRGDLGSIRTSRGVRWSGRWGVKTHF